MAFLNSAFQMVTFGSFGKPSNLQDWRLQNWMRLQVNCRLFWTMHPKPRRVQGEATPFKSTCHRCKLFQPNGYFCTLWHAFEAWMGWYLSPWWLQSDRPCVIMWNHLSDTQHEPMEITTFLLSLSSNSVSALTNFTLKVIWFECYSTSGG